MMNHKFVILLFIICFVLESCNTKNELPDPLEAGWKNTSVCELIQDNKNVRILKCTFEPGVGHERHYHKPHFGYTIAGSRFKIKDTNGIREVEVPTGSHFYSEGVEWHEVLNIGDSTAVFLIIEPK
jgi:quercetin dioxygenase-like cupin family protein